MIGNSQVTMETYYLDKLTMDWKEVTMSIDTYNLEDRFFDEWYINDANWGLIEIIDYSVPSAMKGMVYNISMHPDQYSMGRVIRIVMKFNDDNDKKYVVDSFKVADNIGDLDLHNLLVRKFVELYAKTKG